jgi:Polyketide cyclase / dehydrase and lipid transport
MGSASRHVSVRVDRPAREVYEFAADPDHLALWAAGLGGPVRRSDGGLVVDTPGGAVTVVFVGRNDLGVLDHVVTLPSGESVYNPLRVIPDGAGCEVVFTLRRRPGMSEEAFDDDAAAVLADLATLKRLLEDPRGFQ